MESQVLSDTKNAETKSKLIGFMEENGIEYSLNECCGCEKLCICFSNGENACKNYCCDSGIIVQTSDKNACKVYPHEILYIAIEKRKSVLYLTDRRIETNNQLEHWKNVLDLKAFAQPHHSFIVNLNYVSEVTKDFVKVKYGDTEYSVYTSMRKISGFKKAFLNFKK